MGWDGWPGKQLQRLAQACWETICNVYHEVCILEDVSVIASSVQCVSSVPDIESIAKWLLMT
jgi:hypothetical protein